MSKYLGTRGIKLSHPKIFRRVLAGPVWQADDAFVPQEGLLRGKKSGGRLAQG